MIGDSTRSAEDIAQAAKLDLAARGSFVQTPSLVLARWLFSKLSDPEIRLDAKRGADILQFFMRDSRNGETSFWSEFSLATFQKIAGEHLAAADSLERALQHATTDNIPEEIIAKTLGIMGHAQQSGGILDEAQRTFEDLKNDPVERTHATVHLGEIALSIAGVDAALEIWMSHPQGTTAAVTVIINEADALWSRNPEKSYRLVAEALVRLKSQSTIGSPELLATASRLAARTRENAASSMAAGTPEPIDVLVAK